MAKKQKKRSDQVRSAVDEAFQAAAGQAQVTRDRAQELVDELAGAAERLRDVITGDDQRALRDEVKALRRDVQALGERLTKLESARKTPATARKPAAKRTTGGARGSKPSGS